jgi:hypothetical protein
MIVLEREIQTQTQETPEAVDGRFFFNVGHENLTVEESMLAHQATALEAVDLMSDPDTSDNHRHVLSFRIRYALRSIGRYLDETADELRVNVALGGPGSLPGSRLARLYEEFGAETDSSNQLVIPGHSIGRVAMNPLWDREHSHALITGSTPVADVRIVTKEDEADPLQLYDGSIIPSPGKWSRFHLANIEFLS